MRIAIIDCFAGISGDMTLGSLISCGVPVKHIKSELQKLNLSSFDVQAQKTEKHHISATKINIDFDCEKQTERKYTAIKKMIENSGLNSRIKQKSLQAFRILGEAEAKIHSKKIEDIHFHEVGAVDSIVDLIGSIIGFDYLNVEKIYGTPVPLGTGFTSTDHGNIPVPSPAAIEILKKYPVVHKISDFEMTTPTGATLLNLMVDEILPEALVYTPLNIGYGAGTFETIRWPNLLRLIIAEEIVEPREEKLQIIETNLDDLNPELYPYLMEKMFELGVKDVFLTNIIMKKGRPGVKISVLAVEQLVPQVEQVLFKNTTTLGIRKYNVQRKVLNRKSKVIQTRYGEMKVKEIELDGKKQYRPEFEECKRVAREHHVSILDVYQTIDHQKHEID